MLGINSGGLQGGETDETIASFIAQTSVTFPVVKDNNQSYGLWNVGPSITPFPVDIVVDKTGTVVFVSAEYNAAELRAAIEKAL